MLKLCRNLTPPETSNNLFRRAVRVKTVKWPVGSTVRYWLSQESTEVEAGFGTWNKILDGGLIFERTSLREESDIRVGFILNQGSWSYVGQENRFIPKSEITMNFGWDISRDSDTVLHEIGHAIGLMHEHQHPEAPLEWDHKGLRSWLASPPNNWSDDDISYNVTDRIVGADVTVWDADSIMHYPFPAFVIAAPAPYSSKGIKPAGGISRIDIEDVKLWYPSPQTTEPEPEPEPEPVEPTPTQPIEPEPEPTQPEPLEPEPEEPKLADPILESGILKELTPEIMVTQKYVFTTTQSKAYTFVSLGDPDTYAELRDAKGRFVGRDNNRGVDRNFMIKKQLKENSEYVLYVKVLRESDQSSWVTVY